MHKRIFILCLILTFLTGCFYAREAKQLKSDKEIQNDIQLALEDKVKSEYDLDITVNMKKLNFTYPDGKLMFPVKTSKRLAVPVEIIGNPSYTFNAYISIYDTEREEYMFNNDENSLDIYEIKKFGSFLLEHIFLIRHKEAFDKIKEFDPEVKIELIIDHEYYNRAHEDEHKQQVFLKDFADDYKHDKFIDASYFDELYRKYAVKPDESSNIYDDQMKGQEPCTAIIRLDIKHNRDRKDTSSERLSSIVKMIEGDRDMPNGIYNIYIDEEHAEE